MTKRILFIIIVIAFGQSNYLYSEDSKTDNYSNYGVMFNYGLNYNSASFSKLPGVANCCPKFTDGNGYGVYFSGIYEYMLSDLGITARAGMDISNGKFRSAEDVVISVNNSPVDAVFEHIINYNLAAFSAEIGARYYFSDKLSLNLLLGTNIFVNSHYNQFERISSPVGRVYFLDSLGNNTGKSVRNELSGDIPEINSVQFNSQIGLGYDYFVYPDRSLIIRPEISAGINFGNMVKNLEWGTTTIKFGVSILFSNQNYIPKVQVKTTEDDFVKNIDNIRDELEDLKRKSIEDSIKQIQIEANLRKEIEEKERNRRKIAEQDSLLAIQRNIDKEKQAKLEREREEFNKMIEAENKRSGKICKCFVIMFISTQDKTLAETTLSKLNEIGISDISIKIFNEPYLKTKYYRVQSKCYNNHLSAFDDRNKSYNLLNDIGINPQILCNR